MRRIESTPRIGGRKKQLIRQDPHIEDICILAPEVELAMLAARARGEGVIVSWPQLIDVADGIDSRELALEHKGADNEVMMRMHVVATAQAAEHLIAEHPHAPEAVAARLVGTKIKARVSCDGCLRMSRDVGRSLSGRQ